MQIHTLDIKRSVLRAILDSNRDFIIATLNDAKKGDLLIINETNLIFRIIDVVIDNEALKENYCILVIKELK